VGLGEPAPARRSRDLPFGHKPQNPREPLGPRAPPEGPTLAVVPEGRTSDEPGMARPFAPLVDRRKNLPARGGILYFQKPMDGLFSPPPSPGVYREMDTETLSR
jgi:hypothetical protein